MTNRCRIFASGMPALARGLGLVAAVVASVAACSDGGASEHQHHAHTQSEVTCRADPRVSTFAAGLSAQSASQQLVAELVNADPAPPHKGLNDWTIRFTYGGQAFDGTIEVATIMPDHGHGSPRPVNITRNDDGTYTIGELYLFMGGVWKITFGAPEKGDLERADFTICVE
jgi:hypothetical protein